MKRRRSLFSVQLGLTLAVLAGMIALSAPTPAFAADTDKVYLVMSAKFKPGKAPEATALIRKHFLKVDETIGRKVIPFDYQTGEWDHVVYFPFDPATGETIPLWGVWMKALAAQEGGMDQAQKLFDRYWELTSVTRAQIARVPAAWVP